MPTLLLRFPGGRYHATPWGHHVNEGLVEWPPSPWRLLRALIATGYAKHGWDQVPASGRRLIESLAATLPHYRLPHASIAHSRHYMPTGVLEKGNEKTTLVFDTWADVGDGCLAVRWDCSLDHEAEVLFARLASDIGYLGRSESWVIGQAGDDAKALPEGAEAYPHSDGLRPGREFEQLSLMAAELPVAYVRWRVSAVSKEVESFPVPEGKKASSKLQKDRKRAEAPFPEDLCDCLQKDTAWWKGFRWSQPPGSRRVLYWREASSLRLAPPSSVVRSIGTRVAAMLLALASRSGRKSTLPRRVRSLPQAELLHKSLVSTVARNGRIECPELTGRDSSGKPLKGHRHAHLLPLDLDRDGYLDHILIHAMMGLGPDAQLAVRSLQRTWTKGDVGEVVVALCGQGNLDDLRALRHPLDRGINALLGPVAGACVWVSYTPLVLPRFQKKRGANTLNGQVSAELSSRGLPAATLDVLPWDDQTRDLRHAVRTRMHPAKQPPVDMGYSVKLTFETPVRGPISLGYGAHFGLGLFLAVE